MHIVLTEPLGIRTELLEQYAGEVERLGHHFTSYSSRPGGVEDLCGRVKDADVVIIANYPFPGEAVRGAGNMRYLDIAFTGTEHVDIGTCKERGVAVSNASGYSDVAVAELAFGLMLGLRRNLLPCDTAARSRGTKDGLIGTELYGKTLGVVGTGKIGTAVIRIALAFGMRVLAYNRSKKPQLEAMGVTFVTLEELMAQSDIVTLHVPSTPQTRGLISRELLALMKPTAMLINTARGPVVDNGALAEALTRGQIAGAGIDVFEMEPPLPKDHPLVGAPHTLLTPHVAFATEEAMERRAAIVFDNLKAWLSGTVQNQVC